MKRSITYRANRRGLPNLPLAVRSTGRYLVDRAWGEAPAQKWFSQLFWTIEGRGAFACEGKWTERGPGEIFLYRPGDVHALKAVSERWEYVWVTLDHADIGAWLEGFGLESRAYAPGPCPVVLFSRLFATVKDCTPQGEREAAHLAHAILLAATSRISEPRADSLPARARFLMDRNFEKSAWGISDVVETLGVHRTTLLRGFMRHYGLTPSRYLQNRRLQKALSLLRENELQIQEIAWQAGYSDPNYLARAVRSATGLSPRNFRRQ